MGTSNTSIWLLDKETSPPSWLLKGVAAEDYKTLKSILNYQNKKGIERALLIKLFKEDDIFSSACTAITEMKARKILHA